jgi:TetR/AcrR family transcriptional regulator, cholesterol catabolism regulator
MTYSSESAAIAADPDVRTSVLDPDRARYTPAARKVVDAGVELFARVGFLATTIRDLTKLCGLTAPSFYNHFESKEALLFDIVSTVNSELERRLDALHLDTVASPEALSELVRTLVTFNLTHPKEARIANREWGFLQADLREQVTNHRRRVRSLFERTLQSPKTARGLLIGMHGQVADELEVRLLAMSIVNLSIASSEWYHPDGPLTIDDVAEAYCRLAIRMAGFPQLEATR